MKRVLGYIVTLCAALLAVACEKDAEFGPNEGGITIGLAQIGTRAVSTAGVTIDDCTVYIYERGNSAGELTLIRKYAPTQLPDMIKLLAGSYTAKVQWGEAPNIASFDQCRYEGTADFSVTTGSTSSVSVHCYPQSAVVEVSFDMLDEAISNPQATIELLDAPESADRTSILYDHAETGYFTVPEEGGRLQWTFEADHETKGALMKTGEVQVEGGKKYGLTFRYSPDLPGYIYVMLISVDLSEEEHNNTFVFSPDPEIKGEIISAPWSFTFDEETTVEMQANGNATIQEANIYLSETDGQQTLLWSWTKDQAASRAEEAIEAVLSADGTLLTLTLKAAFFTFPLGDNTLRFELIDSDHTQVVKTGTVSMQQGLRPIAAQDYNLWSNTLTAYAVSNAGAPTFKVREAESGEWRTLTGEQTSGNEYKATFNPEWDESYNEVVATNVYRPKQGIYANKRYEVVAEIEGHTFSTILDTACDQPIASFDAGSSCFTTNNKTHGVNDYWGSGNNSFAKELCTYAVFDGVPCAHLQSTMAGAFGINMLAAGNFFTGTFDRPATTGTVSFGKDYDWQARPKALHVKYNAKIGKVNQQQHRKDGSHPLDKGVSDISVIYVAIVDWEKPHEVKSGTSAPSGMWSPDETTNPGEGAVIGYGIVRLTENDTTESGKLLDLEIPIYYYDRVAKPQKAYKLVISSSASYYGDYMCGCDSNEMYLSDFSWVY